GVLYRVQELADRSEGFVPGDRPGYKSIIPLADILSEIFEVGPKTKKVAGYYQRAVESLGPELGILIDRSFDEIQAAGVPLLAEAIMKMRKGDIHIDPGFDGEFGKVNIFGLREKELLRGEKNLFFSLSGPKVPKKKSSPSPGSVKSGLVKPGLKKIIVKKKKPFSSKSNRPAREPTLLEGLNPSQKQAVESCNPGILIQAGPGTGKTRTLTAKIAYLISEKKTDPNSILALTFTNKAAKQLARRVDTFLPKGKTQVLAATFHGFCLKFLKENLEFNAGLMGDSLRLEMIKNGLESAVQALTIDKKTLGGFSGKKGVGQLDRIISLCKQQLLGPSHDLSSITGKTDVLVVSQVYTAYQQQCQKMNLVDFEDLIFLFYNHLVQSPKLLAQVQNRFAHIFIDEYQDLNLGQYELVKLLAQKSNLVVIGDPDQSIYGFRGSDNKYFKRFTRDYPGCEQIFLSQNYRSTQTILDASFQMISNSFENSGSQKIFSNLNTDQRLIIREEATQTAEAVAVGKMIEKFMGGFSSFSIARNIDAREGESGGKEYSFSDFAVLFRTRKQGEAFAQVFQKEGIPFQTADKKDIYNMDGICQVLSLFRVITSRANAMDYQILKDHYKILSKKSNSKVQADTDRQLGQILEPIYDLVCKRDSLACLKILIDSLDVGRVIEENDSLATAYGQLILRARLYPSPKEFMDYLVLDQDQDHLAGSVEKVSLMTLHSAKGLEYPVVFVTGCEQGLIPFAREGKACENPEEERRLFYVGMTRAMDILCLTYAKKRRIYGFSQKRQRSFFIDDIEKRLAQYEKGVLARENKKVIQLELFP
ncbi:MAG: UvrD-helicase domain-containing protein, partial [Desulfobacteraceae bacterium]|nr:UvrD-helicase domain-containing protein [Desulfobacteraceae bacterium]